MPRLRSLRLVAALLMLLVLSLDRGTGALWNDVGRVPGGTIHTGRIDLRVDGQDAVGGYAPLDLPRLVPGQTAATVLTISNQGNVPLKWTASTSGTNAGNGLLAALQLAVTTASSTSGSTCGGTQLPGSSTSAGGSLVGAPRTLGPGASEQICVQVGLPAGVSSSLASKGTDVAIRVQGTTGGWTDAADVGGVNLSTVSLVPPAVTCSGVLGLSLTMTWPAVPGAKEYRVFNALGQLIDTVPLGGLLKATLGALTGATVKTVYGSEWVSPGAGC